MSITKHNQLNEQQGSAVNQQVILAPHFGKIMTVEKFVEQYLEVLEPFEQKFIERNRSFVLDQLPDLPFDRPLAIANHTDISQSSADINFYAKSIGDNCALLEAHGLYIKGCHPSAKHLQLNLNTDELVGVFHLNHMSAGVLGAESIMREILGYLIYCDKDWPSHTSPVAVMQYNYDGYCGFGLVYKVD